jgi:serine protease
MEIGMNYIRKRFSKQFMGLPAGLLIATLGWTTAVSAQPAIHGFKFKAQTDGLIVKFKDAGTSRSMSQAASSLMASVDQFFSLALEHRQVLGSGAHVFSLKQSLDNRQDLQAVIDVLNRDPNVAYAEPNSILYASAVPDDPSYPDQWHYYESLGGVRLPQAWDQADGKQVVVAVVDTGITYHSDLQANILPGYDLISYAGHALDGDGYDNNPRDEGTWYDGRRGLQDMPQIPSSWHGTHVAGTIAAITDNAKGVAGVASHVKIVPVRVLGGCFGWGTIADIADGVRWAAGDSLHGLPVNANPAQVINMSLGGPGPCSIEYQAALDFARQAGATVVVAAGNSGESTKDTQPANCNGVITVAATDRQGERAVFGRDGYVFSKSNFGPEVDLAAPGGAQVFAESDGVLSTVNTGLREPENGETYAYYQGTSMSAPHVAGVAAMLYQLKPDITPDQVERILKKSTRTFPDSSNCAQCGTGILDAYAAVRAVISEELGNDEPRLVSASYHTMKRFHIQVPKYATKLRIVLSGGTGDADLYVKKGSEPTLSSFDCRPYKVGNNEACDFSNPGTGTYHVMLYAYRAYSNTRLTGTFRSRGVIEVKDKTFSGVYDSQTYTVVQMPMGATDLVIGCSGGTGDADLYVRHAAMPTLSDYDCRPYLIGNQEKCTFPTPPVGHSYIMLHAYRAYANLRLQSSFKSGGWMEVLRETVSGGRYSETRFSTHVPAGAVDLVFKKTGSTGDSDIYVKFGSEPTLNSWDCRPYATGNKDEVCSFKPPATGRYYIMIRGYQRYTYATLTAEYKLQ